MYTYEFINKSKQLECTCNPSNNLNKKTENYSRSCLLGNQAIKPHDTKYFCLFLKFGNERY
jgi:hypothetical protein